ncbi:MAG: ATP-binding protein [Ruminococcus callidus]|nr:ATP-binding protein [Ruminococcus callidus]
MKKRIFGSMVALVGSAMILCFVFVTGLLYEHFNRLQVDQLKETASYVEQGYEEAGMDYFTNLHTGSDRITLIAADGTVLYDSEESDVSTMGNHADREEVQQAQKDGTGVSRRYSDTMSKETVYYAVRLENQSILRLSMEHRSLFAMMGVLLMQALFILLVMMILAAVISYQLTKKIIKPINELDLEHPERVTAYEELDPLLCKLASQNREIAQKMDTLRQQQYEFSMITEHMQEGLFVIDRQYTILACNQSALQLFGIQHSVLQKNILTVERGEPFRNVLEQALRGRHCSDLLEREGRVYQMIANPVLQNETPQEMQSMEHDLIGVVILLLDVTEKEKQERYRREFTANVSHELKTPLTSISGIAEIMKNGIMLPADVPHFAGKIYDESQRLITLIGDIIKLSQLDEQSAPFVWESVGLLELAEAVKIRLQPLWEKRNVTFQVTGTACSVRGVRPVLDEMLYNVCENAIKYNREQGSVTVTVSCQNGNACVTVKDTGIGIPKAEQERVFERFYRVDKSHSKAVGGTGLGLSIVKHGAMLHHAKIQLESAEGAGTTITITFTENGMEVEEPTGAETA